MKVWRAKEKEIKKWSGRSDYDGVILLKCEKPEFWNRNEDDEYDNEQN